MRLIMSIYLQYKIESGEMSQHYLISSINETINKIVCQHKPQAAK